MMQKHVGWLAMGLLLPMMAAAQPVSGVYLGGGAGVEFGNMLQASNNPTQIGRAAGPVGLVDLGWGFGNGFRAEIEGSERSNAVNKISAPQVDQSIAALSNLKGGSSTRALMANLAYDIPVPFIGTPYIGVGMGRSWLNFNNANGQGLLGVGNPGTVAFGSGGAFAYQAMVGTSMPLLVPGFDLTLEYRYFGTDGVNVPVTRVSLPGAINGFSNLQHNSFALHDSALMVGFRYSFAAP